MKRASDCPRDNRDVILLLANIALLVAACFLKPVASISILVPDLTLWPPRLAGLVT